MEEGGPDGPHGGAQVRTFAALGIGFPDARP